jgi:hypothetical protein
MSLTSRNVDRLPPTGASPAYDTYAFIGGKIAGKLEIE